LYDLYTKTINVEPTPDLEIEKLRVDLLKTHREIEIQDLGAKSKHFSLGKRKISEVAETSLSNIRFSSLYHRLAEYAQAKTIVELGTSFGLNTLYLAKTKNVRVYTFEGSATIAEVAEDTFRFAGAKNIELIKGNIDSTLYSTLSRIPKVDFAFIDANHQYTATKKYFEELLMKVHHKSLMVIDDIHASPGMDKAWKEICEHTLVHTSLELYRCGILFFDPSLTKQHGVLQFNVLH
ncbi:MAG: class I SAM-dependent methyltransferase, partial [Cyclobacteriaceae bacterium]